MDEAFRLQRWHFARKGGLLAWRKAFPCLLGTLSERSGPSNLIIAGVLLHYYLTHPIVTRYTKHSGGDGTYCRIWNEDRHPPPFSVFRHLISPLVTDQEGVEGSSTRQEARIQRVLRVRLIERIYGDGHMIDQRGDDMIISHDR